MTQTRRARLALAVIALAGAAMLWAVRAGAGAQAPHPAATADFFPMAAWYGGGKARAPMLEGEARSKKDIWRKDVQQIKGQSGRLDHRSRKGRGRDRGTRGSQPAAVSACPAPEC